MSIFTAQGIWAGGLAGSVPLRRLVITSLPSLQHAFRCGPTLRTALYGRTGIANDRGLDRPTGCHMGIELGARDRHHPRHRLGVIKQGAPDHRLHDAHLTIDGAIVGQRTSIDALTGLAGRGRGLFRSPRRSRVAASRCRAPCPQSAQVRLRRPLRPPCGQ